MLGFAYRGVYRVVALTVHIATLVNLWAEYGYVGAVHTADYLGGVLILMLVELRGVFGFLPKGFRPPDVLVGMLIKIVRHIAHSPRHQSLGYVLGICTQGVQPPRGEVAEGQAELEEKNILIYINSYKN